MRMRLLFKTLWNKLFPKPYIPIYRKIVVQYLDLGICKLECGHEVHISRHTISEIPCQECNELKG